MSDGLERRLRAVTDGVPSIQEAARRIPEAYTISVGELLGDEPTPIEFLVWGMLPRNNVVLLTGQPGCGKSWVAYDLARAVATNTQWFNRGPMISDTGNVLLLNYDNPTVTLRARLAQLGFHHDMMGVRVHTQGRTKPPLPTMPEMLRLPENEGRLRTIVSHYKPSLIIFDSLRQGHNLNEDDSKDAARLMGIFKVWAAMGATVLVLHHTAKTNNSDWKTSARGSGELIGSADVVVEIEEGKIKWTKPRAWELGPVHEAAFELKDKYVDVDDEVEKRTTVTATTPLPGEDNYLKVQHFVTAIKDCKGQITRDEYAARCKLAKPAVNMAIQLARSSGLVAMSRTPLGKVYTLR